MAETGEKCVTQIAKKLNLKLCTARMILKKYKDYSSFPMKKFKCKASKSS